MQILITNDDGVYAPGIKILKDVLKEIADVMVVAPLEERSTTGHTLTLDKPLRLVEVSPDVYGCSGFPADCILLGFGHLLKNRRPDLVVSGINRGANLGQDIFYSGTVAAAREATFHGIPSISISTVVDFKDDVKEVEYSTAANFVKDLIKQEGHKLIEPMSLLNINVPNQKPSGLKGVELTRLGFQQYSEEIEKRYDFRERAYYWVGGIYKGFKHIENSDCLTVHQKKISLTHLNLLSSSDDKPAAWVNFVDQFNK